MYEIKKVNSDCDIENVAALADKIWHEHYGDILPAAQIDYMVEKFQSFSAIKNSIEFGGYDYYIVADQFEKHAGYFGVKPDSDALFVSKLYLEASARGNGLGKICINKCADIAREKGLKKLRLTVNRENPSYGFYRKMNFCVAREEDTFIGDGFYINDYVMELSV